MKKIVYLFVVVLCTIFYPSCVNVIEDSPNASINNGNSGSAQGRGGWVTGGLQFGIGPSRSGSSCTSSLQQVAGRPRPQPFSQTRVRWERPCGSTCGGRTCGYSNCRQDRRLAQFWGSSQNRLGYRPTTRRVNPQPEYYRSIPRAGDQRPRYGVADTLTGRSQGIRPPEYLARARAQQR